MSGMSLMSLANGGWIPLLALALLVGVGVFGGLLVHLWVSTWRWFGAFWHAVALCVYLHRPWRSSWDKARRRAS